MKKPSLTKSLLAFLLFFSPCYLFSQSDVCSAPTSISSAPTCTNVTNQTIQNKNQSSPNVTTGTCGGTAGVDVWYSFTAQTTSPTISLSTIGASIRASAGGGTHLQVLSGSCPSSFTSLACTSGAGTSLSLSPTNLTVGQTYFIRIYITPTTATGGTAAAWGYSICVTDPGPGNDNCANASLLTSATTCIDGTSSLSAQTLYAATADGGAITSNCTATNNADVWYKFVAQSQYPIILLSNFGSSWSNHLKMQLLSGSCGSFTEVACGNNSNPFPSFSVIPSGGGLTVGNTYYIRIQKNNGGAPTGGAAAWAFDICVTDPATTGSGRMNEVFKQTILSGPNILADPWEITYGPDNMLWITESKGYKVYRMDPQTGVKTMVLDISDGSTFLGPDTTGMRSRSNNAVNAQGGLAGLALHPHFMDGTPSETNYVYISYVYSEDSVSVFNGGCHFFKNHLVRFTYDKVANKLGSPVALCDTLPGGNDHNSQRMIIAPVGGTYYLFYAQGDMGAGQLACQYRVENAQNIYSYEGKILRFNLDTDHDNGTLTALDNWIPNDNPYNTLVGKQSAVWAMGIRNNQGFAYDTALNILYGSSHGPYSDDEINIIEPFRNYGHPLVIGYASDGNYNGTTTQPLNTSVTAGVPFTTSSGIGSLPPIGDEMANKAAIDASGHGLYKDPLFSAYPAPNGDITTPGTIKYIWKNNPGNATPAPGWPSEAWSGLDLYTNTLIPGWKKSLVAASLKWGRLVRIKLAPSGTITLPSNDPINNAGDTISYFGSQNRFRDLAFAPNGKDIYVVMDRSTTTSGPSAQWPVVPTCQGCVQKYTFLGYNDVGGKSSIPASIDVTDAPVNTVDSATTITIDSSNNFLWVPITGPDGNIMAEIYPNGQNLGIVRSAFYKNSGAIRSKKGVAYLDRNITITPQFQPSDTVKIRLYLSKTEYDALDADPTSGVSAITDLKILKNQDPCSAAIASSTLQVNPTFAETHGVNGYMLQGAIASFSSFYFASSNILLPLNLITFKGSLQNNNALLDWETSNEVNTARFVVERSIDAHNFQQIGTVDAKGTTGKNKYSFVDYEASHQSSLIIYYRLRMIDRDGGYTYSDVVAITLPSVTSKVAVFPNPASHQVKVNIAAAVDGTVQWTLTDNSGRIAMQNSAEVKKGNNSFSINVNSLSTGFYYLNIHGAGIDQQVKLEKL